MKFRLEVWLKSGFHSLIWSTVQVLPDLFCKYAAIFVLMLLKVESGLAKTFIG